MASESSLLEAVQRRALALPGVEEGTSYGTPAFRVRGTFLARMHDDGEHLVVKVDLGEREALVRSEPETFSVTPHYQSYPLVLVRLATVDLDELGELLEEAWRRAAPKRLVAAYDAAD